MIEWQGAEAFVRTHYRQLLELEKGQEEISTLGSQRPRQMPSAVAVVHQLASEWHLKAVGQTGRPEGEAALV